MLRYRTGKKPATDRKPISFKLSSYLSAAKLPTPPLVIGRPWLVAGWGMLANDNVGDCVLAGAAHETMLWNAEAGKVVQFSDAAVLADYSAITGYNPNDPNSDQGTDTQAAASYRQKTGLLDAAGNRHKIDAYAELNVGDLDQLALAVYQLGAVGVGVQLPSTAETQFDHAEPWDVVGNASDEGGHYVPCVGRNSRGNFLLITWGRLQAATPAWLKLNMDEAVAYVSVEQLAAVSVEGAAALQSDLNSIRSAA